MRFTTLGLVSLLSSTLLAAPAPSSHGEQPFSTFTDVTVFTPPSDYTDPGTLYARTVLLKSGTLLATWENYSPEPPLVYFPIYRSTDGGESWKEISKVQDTANHLGLRYQPFLYELEQPFGGLPAGAILLAGNSIPTLLNTTQIDLYASLDEGLTWRFISHIASGGQALPDNGLTPVWEPFLMMYDNQLVAYYSDQRDPAHGQKLSHQTTRDLKHWSAPVDDVAYPTYTDRPGMTTVTKLPNGNYMMTYEYGGGPTNQTGYQFPAYYRINANPLDFNSSPGLPVKTPDGTQPTSSPYITWTPVGDARNGTIVVSTGSHSQVYVNQQLGAEGAWRSVNTPEGISYSRHLRVMPNPDHLLLIGGGMLPPSSNNSVTVSVMDLGSALKAL